MNIYEVSLRDFQGFDDLAFKPRSHVALVGEPRAGRSNLIEGLRRVLTSDGVRYTTPSGSTCGCSTDRYGLKLKSCWAT